MFAYYVRLGFVHLRRNPILTALMVLTLAVGIAASMSTLTVLYAMSNDPIPTKSDRLFVPLLDVRPVETPDTDVEPPDQLTYRDAVALKEAGKGVRQLRLLGVGPAIAPARPDVKPFFSEGIAVDTEFFPMLDVPFVAGGPWTADDDARGARVTVLRAGTADKVFGTTDVVGRSIRFGQDDFQVVGVIEDDWRPLPKFYRMVGGATWEHEEVMLPFTTAIAAEMDPQGSVNCPGDSPDDSGDRYEAMKRSECVWIQMLVELPSAADAPAYRDFLASYVAEQRKLGRFPRADNHRLHDVMGWLEVNKVVSRDTRLQVYLAFGFLLVCLVNVVGLLLAKFTARAGEIGVRRALGASRRAVFAQYLTEVGVVGLVGGLAGLLLAYGCLWLIGQQSEQLAVLARMDLPMLATTFVLAIGSSLVAGLLPTWRACQVLPAVQLKSQ